VKEDRWALFLTWPLHVIWLCPLATGVLLVLIGKAVASGGLETIGFGAVLGWFAWTGASLVAFWAVECLKEGGP
jgi:hypothetical protein